MITSRFRVAVVLVAVALAASACGTGGSDEGSLNWYIFEEPGGTFTQAAKACSTDEYTIEVEVLPSDADQQREQLVRRLAPNDTSIALIGMDVIWTASSRRRDGSCPSTATWPNRPPRGASSRRWRARRMRTRSTGPVHVEHPAALVPHRPGLRTARDVGRDARHGRVAVLRKGVVQQVGTPRELYNEPVNLFVGGFIGSPAMNFLAGQGGATTPWSCRSARCRSRRSCAARWRRRPTGSSSASVPEHLADASLASEIDGPRFTAQIDVIEWMGAEVYAHFRTEADASAELDQLAEELEQPAFGGEEQRQLVARLDAQSDVREGKEHELVVDARRILLFDAETGENLAVGARETTAV